MLLRNLTILLDTLVSLSLSLFLLISSLIKIENFELFCFNCDSKNCIQEEERRKFEREREIKKEGMSRTLNIEIFISETLFLLEIFNTYEYCSSSSDMFAGGHGTATRKQNHRLTQLILN